ncbi:MAG: hypothetical protein ACD_37C00234G0009 [uncultured bacterium]|nr:MAG: hypothetical protein ACD_37C00234G0009 [uncultured bacterium]
MELADNLNTRFNIAVRSSSELEFYQNLYHYFDFIHKTPELLAIFEASDRDYGKKHSAIWKNRSMTEEEIKEAAAQTTKLERFNLFAVAASIYARIYYPLDHYRNSSESDQDQDIVAVILMRGAGYAASLKKWSKEDLKFYTRWFDGRRDHYERELRLFHAMFLDELSRSKNEKADIAATFSENEAVLMINNKVVKLPAYRNEYCLCKVVFERLPNELIDWSLAYEEMTGNADMGNTETAKRKVYDAVLNLNKRVLKLAGIKDFIIWDNNTLRRTA